MSTINYQYQSLKEIVYQYIADRIQNGLLAPSEKINEAEICKTLGISRTPAREALFQLTSDNLLEYMPRKGFIVKEIDTKKKTDVFEIIGTLESLAASLALAYMTEQDILEMETIVATIEDAIRAKDFSAYQKGQSTFHDYYINKCNNSTLVKLLHDLKYSFIRQTYLCEDKERLFRILSDSNDDHKRIIEAFRTKDADKLRKYTKSHWDTIYLDMIWKSDSTQAYEADFCVTGPVGWAIFNQFMWEEYYLPTQGMAVLLVKKGCFSLQGKIVYVNEFRIHISGVMLWKS